MLAQSHENDDGTSAGVQLLGEGGGACRSLFVHTFVMQRLS